MHLFAKMSVVHLRSGPADGFRFFPRASLIYLVNKKLQARLVFFLVLQWRQHAQCAHPSSLTLNGANEDEWVATAVGAAARLAIQMRPSDDL